MCEVRTMWAAKCGLVGLLRGALLSNLLDDASGWLSYAGTKRNRRKAGWVQWSWMDTRYGARNHKYFHLYTVTVLTRSCAETAVVSRQSPGCCYRPELLLLFLRLRLLFLLLLLLLLLVADGCVLLLASERSKLSNSANDTLGISGWPGRGGLGIPIAWVPEARAEEFRGFGAHVGV